MIVGAFIGWQSGAGGKQESFSKYCRRMGLIDGEEPLSGEQKKQMAEYAKQKAEAIVRMDNNGR